MFDSKMKAIFKSMKKSRKINYVVIVVTILAVSLLVGSGTIINKVKLFAKKDLPNTESSTYKSAANPGFTLQHYFYFEHIDTKPSRDSIDSGIKVVNTDNGGKGLGGNLPTNGNETISYVDVVEDSSKGSDYYKLVTRRDLTKMFADEETTYKENPTINYMDRLYNSNGDYNANYTLYQVWVLKPGSDKDSISASDWYVYNVPRTTDGHHDPEAINFTNNPDNPNITELEDGNVPSKDKYTILIEDGSVVRLVFDTIETKKYVKTGVNFFDYDLTDGYIYSASNHSEEYRQNTSEQKKNMAGPWYTYTKESGINSPSNYTDADGKTKYAFGNSDGVSGSGLGDGQWTDASDNINYINRANKSVNESQAVYGLVTGFDASGKVEWADGIAGPDLFGSSAAVGKTSYMDNQFSLNFYRKGGTFTLSGLNYDGAEVHSGYDTFILRKYSASNHIFSNDFWPMDYAPSYGADNHDLVFGSAEHGGKIINNSNHSMPAADDGVDHNPYFGMSFESEFTLEPGYVAPLDFFFFGDDDLWIFLTNPEGETKQIADIGGVHSALGEYINLWDYIEPIPYTTDGVENKSSGTYKLNFFYTERGASGSTAYMRFTIPLDTATSESNYTKQLKIEKEAINNPFKDATYTFKIDLFNKDNTPYQDIYDYVIYEGSEKVATDTLKTGDEISLKSNQYAVIEGLPDTTYYRVTEVTKPVSKVTYQLGIFTSRALSDATEGEVATSNIKTHDYVKFTNTYANLSLTKKTVGSLKDEDNSYTFNLTMDNNISGKYGDITFNNGKASVTLKAGDTKYAVGLPEGINYTISEDDSDKYIVYNTNSQGQTKLSETIKAEFINALKANLTISEKVQGEKANQDKNWRIEIKLTAPNGITLNNQYAYTGSKDGFITFETEDNKTYIAIITLKHDEILTIKDLPEGTSYEIIELDANKDGYKTTMENNKGTLTGEMVVPFVNERNVTIPNTLDNIKRYFIIFGMTLAIAILSAIYYRQTKKLANN